MVKRFHGSRRFIFTGSWSLCAGAEVLSVDITIPIESRHDVIEKYRAMLDAHSNVKIAVLGEKVSQLVSTAILVLLIIIMHASR